MITRLLLSACCLALLLVPTLAWSLNEPGEATAAQSKTAIAQPEQTAPPKAAPISPVQDGSAKQAPVQTAPAKLAPAANTPLKPVPAQSAPVPTAPMQAAPVQSSPAIQVPDSTSNIASHTIDIEVFMREGCLNCDKANEFLAKLQNLKPQLKINIRDVRKEPAALQLLKRMADNQGGGDLDYPAFVVGGQLIIGFTEEASTAQKILDKLPVFHPASAQEGNDSQSCETGKEAICGLIAQAPVVKPESTVVEMFGYRVPLAQIELPLFTIIMGLLDGLNHGSTWVLVLMISLLTPMKDRTLLLTIAGTFIAVQGLIYFILMAAWLNLFMLIDITRISQIIIASIALLAGAIYFKNYLYVGHNLALTSPEISKPGIYTRIRKIVQAESLVIALPCTILLAILVQIGEFSYSSAFPALYTHVLNLQNLDSLSNYVYLLLYDFAYMLDDIVVLTIGVITLSQVRSQEKTAPLLKLISGLIFAGTGAYLLLTLL